MKKYNQGLSLIELLIAMVIALLLLLGTASLFSNNKRIYKEQNEMGRLQENARFALELLIRDIRMAGYSGCQDNVDNVTNHIAGSGAGNLLYFGDSVEGSDNGGDWLPSNATEATSASPTNGLTAGAISMAANSDAITVRYLAPSGVTLVPPYMTPSAAAIHAVSPNGLFEGEMLAISDCDSADIFQISNANPDGSGTVNHATGASVSPGNAFKDMSKTYGADAEILRLVSRRYFVATSDSGSGELALFRHTMDYEDIDGDGDRTEFISQELIEGIESLQILYGEDTIGSDTIADTYVNAAAVNNWDDVVSVRIGMLVRTIKQDYSTDLNTNTYNLLGVNFDPNPDDHRRRRVFEATVQIRNRTE